MIFTVGSNVDQTAEARGSNRSAVGGVGGGAGGIERLVLAGSSVRSERNDKRKYLSDCRRVEHS